MALLRKKKLLADEKKKGHLFRQPIRLIRPVLVIFES